ncbi:MAG: hypothetical protein RIA38_00700 [Microcella pacifica]|uniref:hypothetical protein n=1 Tax=Microcella pacifica TaxID=2591847 RepID=UPI003315413E
MTARPSRLVLLSAESNSLTEARSAALPGVPILALCWQAPDAETSAALSTSEVVDLSQCPRPLSERAIAATGLLALSRALSRTAPGRLIASFGPAHRSRLFAARVQRSGAWAPRSGDVVIALDTAATRAAWFAQRRVEGVQARVGLRAGLSLFDYSGEAEPSVGRSSPASEA